MPFLALITLLLQSASASAPQPRSLGDEEGWARDVVFLDTGAIVIADWDSNAQVSVDGGKTWSTHPMLAPVECMTVDPRGAVWGLYRWHGIHEPPSAALVFSKDEGRTWSEITLDPSVCMPEDFVTLTGEEPVLVTSTGQQWRHADGGEETFERWNKLGAPCVSKSASTGLAAADFVYFGPSGELSKDRGTSWRPTTLERGVVALARAVDADGKALDRVFACTDDGAVHAVELGKQNWMRIASLAPKKFEGAFASPPRIFHSASGRDGLYVCGETGAKALGARIEPDGKAVKLEGLASNQSLRLRLAPDGRMWIAGHGVYAAEPKATRWERVWPK